MPITTTLPQAPSFTINWGHDDAPNSCPTRILRDGVCIALVPGGHRNAETREHAQSIVRACESETTLLPALQRALSDLERIFEHPQANSAGAGETNIASLAHAAGARLRAALKQHADMALAASADASSPHSPVTPP